MAQATELDLSLKLSGDSSGAELALSQLNDTLGNLTNRLQGVQAEVQGGRKDWLDYATEISQVAESLTATVTNAENVVINAAEIAAGIAIYKKWLEIVTALRTSYATLTTVIDSATAAAGSATNAAWGAISGQALKLEARIGSLAARFAGLGDVASALSFAGVVLTLASIAENARQSNEDTRQLTESIGELSKSLQALDPASASVKTAKERFEELQKASLALQQEMPELVDQYKAFFDITKDGNTTIQQAGRLLTDFNQVQKSLRSSSQETTSAQEQLFEALRNGLVTVPKLAAIFGSALNPALDVVAANMGTTHAQLAELIDTGQIGADKILPALAAAARTVTQPLGDAGDAAEFSRQQFTKMGETFYSLSEKILPGVTNELQYTAREIAATADAAVDPIGAAVEQIINFGSRIQEWARLTQQSIKDAFSGPDVTRALKTGFQEALYGLDFVLVGLREEINAAGQSIGILAGAATTATNPTEELAAVWKTMSDRVMTTRDRLNEYIEALEGVDHSSERTQEAARNLVAALKTLPEIKLPDALQEIVNKLNSTQTASDAVGEVWKELAGLDFTGSNLKNLLILNKTIDDVSDATKNASGVQEEFSKKLAELPTKPLVELLTKVEALSPRLKEAGGQGELMNVVLGAVFKQLSLDVDTAGGKVTQYGKDAAAAFSAIAKSAETSGLQVRAALDAALNAAKTKSDVDLITAEFNRLATAGKLSGQLISDGQLAILSRLKELIPAINPVEKAFSSLGMTSTESLRNTAEVAKAAFNDLQSNGIGTLNALQQGFLAWADAELKAAQAANLPVPSVLRQQAAALGLTNALQLLIEKYPALNREQEAHLEITKRNVDASRFMVSSLQALADAQIQAVQQEIALAEAKGQTWIVQKKNIELQQLEAHWQEAIAGAMQAALVAEQADIQAKLDAKLAIINKTQADYAEIDALELKKIALGKEAEAQALAQQVAAEREKLQPQITTQTQQHTEATQENAKAVDEEALAQQRYAEGLKYVQAMLNGAQNYYQKSRDLMGELSDATQQYYDLQFTLALSNQGVAGSYEILQRQLRAWNEGMGESAQRLREIQEEIGLAHQSVQQGEQKMLFAMNFFQRWEAAVDIATGKAKAAYYEEAQQAELLQSRLEELTQKTAGTVQLMQATSLAAQRLENGFTFLDQEDLANLRKALEDAKQKLEAMQQATADARTRLSELNAELLEAQGQDQKAALLRQQLDYQQQLTEIEAQRAEAEATHNRELLDTLDAQKRVLAEINQAKLANIEADAQENVTTKTSLDATTQSIQNVGAALDIVHALGQRVAALDLSGLHSQMTGLADQAGKLRDAL